MPAQRASCEGEAYEIEFLEVPNLVYRTLGGGFLKRGTHTPTRQTIFGGHMVEESIFIFYACMVWWGRLYSGHRL